MALAPTAHSPQLPPAATMPIKLYIDHMSQPSRAVWAFCIENKIDHQVKIINIAQGGTRTESYRTINPLGKVPCIDDDGYVLAESHAIMRYLATTRQVADNWYPCDPKRRAKIDEYLAWHHGNLRTGSAGLVFAHVLGPMLGATITEDSIKKARSTLKGSLQLIENYFLAKTPFLNSTQMSIADLSMFGETEMLRLVDYDLTKYPRICRWMERMRALPSYATVHATLNKVIQRRQENAQRAKL